MSKMRGIILIVLGVLALYRGWTLHSGQGALIAYALGALSLAIGVWRVTRKESRPPA